MAASELMGFRKLTYLQRKTRVRSVPTGRAEISSRKIAIINTFYYHPYKKYTIHCKEVIIILLVNKKQLSQKNLFFVSTIMEWNNQDPALRTINWF